MRMPTPSFDEFNASSIDARSDKIPKQSVEVDRSEYCKNNNTSEIRLGITISKRIIRRKFFTVGVKSIRTVANRD